MSATAGQPSPVPPGILQEIAARLHDTPEQQRVVGPLVAHLVSVGWSLDQIVFGKREYIVPWPPNEASKREKGRRYKGVPVDIAVFDDKANVGRYDHLLFIIECKRPDEPTGLEQLHKYLGMEPEVRLGVWANSADPAAAAVFLFKDERGRAHPQKRNVAALPTPTSQIDKDYRGLSGNDLIVPSADSLRAVFGDMLDRVVARDPHVTRREDQLDQLCNVILLKLDSDKQAKLTPSAQVTFKAGASEALTAKLMRQAFAKFVDSYATIFHGARDRELRFADHTLAECMDDLAALNVLRVGPQAVSLAFQVLRSAALKQKEGQYFTPQPVIAAAVRFMDLSPSDRIVDPACGTGGFLVEAMVAMEEKVVQQGGDPEGVKQWAASRLHGIDKDSIAVKLTKAVMQIMGDGSAHCARGDSVATHRWATDYPHLATEFRNGSFDVVLTNPPFGAPLTIRRVDANAAGLTIQDPQAEHGDVELGLAMFNRCHQLLRAGGRLCIVLPETYFFSPSYRPVRRWTWEHFVPEAAINVPMEAFQGFCRAKTNVYIFRKLADLPEGASDDDRTARQEEFDANEVVMLNPRTCGIYKNGDTRFRVTPDGERTAEVDDEMMDHTQAWLAHVAHPAANSPSPPGAVTVPAHVVVQRDVLVPTYYDPRYFEDFGAVLESLDCAEVTIGRMMSEGWIHIRGGHGSISNDRRRGTVPYIKVSDIRSLRVNVNPTNLAPRVQAEKLWRGPHSSLEAWDLITPNRASSNIGEFAVLLPGEEDILLTKEVFVIRVTEDGLKHFDPFYLLWAFSLRAVRNQWRRIALMQTNREDVGGRHREIRIPMPSSRAWADAKSKPFRDYFQGIARSKADFMDVVRSSDDVFIASIYSNNPSAISEEPSDEDDGPGEAMRTEDAGGGVLTE